MAVVPTVAQADPVRAAGCKTVTATQKYTAAGITAYGQFRALRWCWTGGPVMQSKIYGITGDADCWSNATFQDQNCKGPTDGAKIPISSSQRLGNGSTRVYFWFQSRNCATGPLNLVCSGWAWHGARYVIKQGGGWYLEDGDV